MFSFGGGGDGHAGERLYGYAGLLERMHKEGRHLQVVDGSNTYAVPPDFGRGGGIRRWRV